MGLPFFENGTKKRDDVVAIDLGGRTTKAVFLQHRDGHYILSRYALLDAPIYEKTLSVELLTEHLKAVSHALDAKGRLTAIALGVNDSLMRHVEMPRMPVDDMRQVLKNNSRNYLQEDLPNHVFDCFLMPIRAQGGQNQVPGLGSGVSGRGTSDARPETRDSRLNTRDPGLPLKQKVLVAGAKKQLVDDFLAAIKAAGMVAGHIVPGLLGPVNTFEAAMPEVFSRSVVALVDIGFKHSSIAIIAEGELVLSRVVAIGGDRFSAGLAETMGISYAEAEGIKVGMASEVQPVLESLLTPLGRELRASMDFFEHQHDRPVLQVYLSGGSAKSAFVLQALQNELGVECKTWMPTTFLQMALPPQQTAEIDHVAPQLTTALGAALTAL